VQRPTAAELEAAAGRTVPDVGGPGLRVLFVGINPGLWSGAVGHHFAHPGNRFWKALHASGFTGSLLHPTEERRLLAAGLGVTNLVPVATRSAAELSPEQLRAGAAALEAKVRDWSPRVVAFLGLGAYRSGFGRPAAGLGPQREPLGGRPLWLLPNPSGLQAHYPFERLVAELRALRDAAGCWPPDGDPEPAPDAG
jgi:double-stranded uracil-DNA glycosylase